MFSELMTPGIVSFCNFLLADEAGMSSITKQEASRAAVTVRCHTNIYLYITNIFHLKNRFIKTYI